MTGANIKIGLKNLNAAATIREKISKLYSHYNLITNQVTLETDITKADFKRAVDALYYLGGGWPHANSKGRLETMLDNFAAVLKILDFAGEAEVIYKHLARHGISVKLNKVDRLKNARLKRTPPKLFSDPHDSQDLVHQAITLCMSLQREICESADQIKYDLKPKAKKALQIEDEEYDRLFGAVRLKTPGERGQERIQQKKKNVENSVQNFQAAIEQAARDKLTDRVPQ